MIKPNASGPPAPHPWHRQFWLGEIDPRPVALLRMALALVLLVDLGERLRDFHAFYSSTGITVAPRSPFGFPNLSVFFLFDDARVAIGVFLLGIALAVALAVGWHTRVVSLVTWVFVMSVHNRNAFVCDGGDNVLRLMLFWGLWSSWGQRWSLDARRYPHCKQIFAFPVRMMQLQVAYIYLASAIYKHGETWLDGSAVHRVLNAGGFTRGWGYALAAHPTLCMFLTYATLAVEFALPVLLFAPWRRGALQAVAIVCGVALHVGIFVTMRIGLFSCVMPASFLVFVQPHWIDRVARAVKRSIFITSSADLATVDAPILNIDAGHATKVRLGAAAFLSLVVALVCVDVGLAAADIHSQWVSTPLALLGQSQHWPMFAPDVPRKEYQLKIAGNLADGSSVDLVANLLPDLASSPGFRYSRWRKLRETLVIGNPRLRGAFGRYVCRRALGGVLPNLRGFDLFVHTIPLDPPGAMQAELSMHQDCVRQGAAPR